MADPDPQNPAHRALVEGAAAALQCPRCGHVGFDVAWTLTAESLGGSLAVQCGGCGLRGPA